MPTPAKTAHATDSGSETSEPCSSSWTSWLAWAVAANATTVGINAISTSKENSGNIVRRPSTPMTETYLAKPRQGQKTTQTAALTTLTYTWTLSNRHGPTLITLLPNVGHRFRSIRATPAGSVTKKTGNVLAISHALCSSNASTTQRQASTPAVS